MSLGLDCTSCWIDTNGKEVRPMPIGLTKIGPIDVTVQGSSLVLDSGMLWKNINLDAIRFGSSYLSRPIVADNNDYSKFAKGKFEYPESDAWIQDPISWQSRTWSAAMSFFTSGAWRWPFCLLVACIGMVSIEYSTVPSRWQPALTFTLGTMVTLILGEYALLGLDYARLARLESNQEHDGQLTVNSNLTKKELAKIKRELMEQLPLSSASVPLVLGCGAVARRLWDGSAIIEIDTTDPED